MWIPKGCDRCHGDLYESEGEDGTVSTCLQCGREVLTKPRYKEMSAQELWALFNDEEPAKAA